MKFIVLLITVLLQRQTKVAGYQRNRSWFSRLIQPLPISSMTPRMQVLMFALVVLLPAMLLGVFIHQMPGLMGSLLSFVLQVLMFLYILGRDDFSQRFSNYQASWCKEDYQGAYECAQGFLDVDQKEHTHTPQELHNNVKRAIVWAWFKRFFIFVFWFLVAGIGGALTCLLTYWFQKEYKLDWLKSLVGAIEWAPARLLALTTALGGNFNSSFPQALQFAFDFQTPSKTVLAETAFAEDKKISDFQCQDASKALEEANQLMFRCAVIWLLFVAFLTVFTGY
jgi:AmpE protein